MSIRNIIANSVEEIRNRDGNFQKIRCVGEIFICPQQMDLFGVQLSEPERAKLI